MGEESAGGRGRPRWRRWWRLWVYPLCLLVAIVGLLMWFEESLIFFPSPYPAGEWNPPDLAPEDAWFTAADGAKLHGWYVRCDKPRAFVLFCHGNAGNITHRIDALRALHDDVRASVLIFDYRGYGRSEGTPSGAGVLADARAARRWLAECESIDERQIVLLGESIGGAVAVDLAAADGARALVLQSTFTSIPDMAGIHYPWLPLGFLIRTRLDSLSKIGNYHGPLLFSQGDADTIVPFENGRKLFAAANQPKQFIRLPGRDHNDPLPREYYDALARFLDSLD
jgi:uncharacterized protein